MKSLKFLAVISLLLLPEISNACYYPWYFECRPSIYRIEKRQNPESQKNVNLLEWQQMTSADIPLDDIEQVVYTMSLEEYEVFCNLERYTGDNLFARWIKEHDAAIMDFLLLAKRNEHIRFRYSSVWYYPTMKVKGPMTLEEVIEASFAATDKRLHTRYMLQAMRAMYTLKRYDECIDLWNNEFEKLPMEDAMRRHAYLYIAGAFYHTGQVEEAINMYAEAGDIASIYYIAKLENLDISQVELIEMLYRNNPNTPEVFSRMTSIIYKEEGPLFNLDYDSWVGTRGVIGDDCRALLDVALRLGAEGRDAAMWYYTAAYIYYMDGRIDDAYATLALAEKSKPSPFMSDSIEVLRIIFDAGSAKLGKKYDQQLLKQLRWLENKCYGYIGGVDEEYAQNLSFYIYPTSIYYWGSMMNYVINELLVPRYIEAGDGVRALYLANYSSYYLLSSASSVCMDYYDDNKEEWVDEGYWSYNYYRTANGLIKGLDYSTFFFGVLDTSDVDDVLAYVDGVKSPKSALERHLNRGSFIDDDYFNDIAGTLCLRNMRYAEAEEYLSKVNYHFNASSLNVSQRYDPFKFERVERSNPDFRYNFAHKMASLERAIANSTDNNRRASYMISYAIGLNNSFMRCWELTHYHRGCVPHMYKLRYWEQDKPVVEARAKARSMVQEALTIVNNYELAAEIHYMFGNFRTVALDYGSTKYGKIVNSCCDGLIDYNGDRLGNTY